MTIPPLVSNVRIIQAEIAQASDLPLKRLLSRERSSEVSQARHLAMALCREFTTLPLAGIADRFGVHHKAVQYALQHVEALRSTDPKFAHLFTILRDRCLAAIHASAAQFIHRPAA